NKKTHRKMKRIYSIAALLMLAQTTMAQVEVITDLDAPDTSAKKSHSFSISVGSEETKDSSEKIFDLHIGMLDLGFNSIDDNTNYKSFAAQGFLDVNANMKNKNLFSLREGKSINVNIYPVLLKARVLKTQRQRVYVTVGAGLQIYNFRFNRPISYV